MQLKCLLIIGFVWPEPSSTAAGNRMLQLIHFFLNNNYSITFASTAGETELSVDLESMGVQKVVIKLNHASFDSFVSTLNPDTVLFDRFLTEEQFGWRVAKFAPQALRILNTEDLHSLRNSREKSVKSNQTFTTDLWLQNDMTKREMASIYRCDLSLIISSYEMELLTSVVKIDKNLLLHLPFLLDELAGEHIKEWTPFENRTDFICIGNGKHSPNTDAIAWLKKEIWPLIRKQLPKAQLRIYGAYQPAHIQQMHSPKEGFLVLGWISDLQKTMQQARVNLAPLRFGAGIKGKLITAMQEGTPSITTPIGAESMHANLEWSGHIANNAVEFAEAAVAFHTDEQRWKRAQLNGIEIINTLYNKKPLGKKLHTKIKDLQQRLEHHRTQNFIGGMLMHQTMTSTVYMSKWIEAKNLKVAKNVKDDKTEDGHH